MRWGVGLLIAAWWIGAAGAEEFKRLPPDGIAIGQNIRNDLTARVEKIGAAIERQAVRSGDTASWRPDVEVFVRAVRLALQQNLFFKENETRHAGQLLDEAERRLQAAKEGDRGLQLMGLEDQSRAEPQLLVGGFVSRIDDSVQPFGLVVPAGFRPDNDSPQRMDVWLHGRGDTKTEVPFLHERMTKQGQYAPADTFVLHPFGRHCNAFKFAGETDVYEAIDRAGQLFAVDDRRVAIRGFSMGGAGCWHLAVHDSGRWFAANPGAGFVDTIQYQGWDKRGMPFPLDSTRQKLMNWYDVLPWVGNLRNTRTIAYSGEVDKQKQAADRVSDASKRLGFDWPYVIGAGMGHKIDADSAKSIDRTLDRWAEEESPRPVRDIDFVTYTLRYHRVDWLQVTGLQQHWAPGHVRAHISGDSQFEVTTEGVTGLRFDFHDSGWPTRPINAELQIDGQTLTIEDWGDAEGIQCELRRAGQRWEVVEEVDARLRKRPGLQGPIDDAFCERFLFVLPSRPASHGAVQRWIDRESKYAIDRWRRLMRGKVNVVRDSELTDQQIADCHLICFGDLASNRYLARVAEGLPLTWTRDRLRFGSESFDPSEHAPVFCYPNPGNPNRYLVVNSGMTFREFSNVSNSRQIAMLPDWAVLKVDSSADDPIFAGEVAAEGFFDERWQLRP